jgi:serine/threonine protein kinase
LSARNILLTHDKKAKVSDFGLAARIYTLEEEISEIKVAKPGVFPFRWAAYEVLETGTAIKESSDVWSFGVLTWEIFHLGCALPYGDKKTLKEVKEFLQKGYRLSQPDYCPKYIHDLMLECWQTSHLDRPTFSQLKILMTNFNNIKGKIQVSLCEKFCFLSYVAGMSSGDLLI